MQLFIQKYICLSFTLCAECRRAANTKKHTSDIQDYLMLLENCLETLLYPIKLQGDFLKYEHIFLSANNILEH